jgi:hypothetical protein
MTKAEEFKASMEEIDRLIAQRDERLRERPSVDLVREAGPPVRFFVTEGGCLRSDGGNVFVPQEALRLSDWIRENFGVEGGC